MTEQKIVAIKNEFQTWASGFSGCTGGNIGNHENRSIWFCGIEWGFDDTIEGLEKAIQSQVDKPPLGYEFSLHKLRIPYNRQKMKLITAINGGAVANYEETIERHRPFVKDSSSGYFKMNLLPIPFKDTGHQRWKAGFNEITGFSNKQAYLNWCRQVRFSHMRNWVSKYKPKAIVCFGKTWINDFATAFVSENLASVRFTKEKILTRELSWMLTADNVLVIVCPFPLNRHGLNSNTLLQAFGDRIKELINN